MKLTSVQHIMSKIMLVVIIILLTTGFAGAQETVEAPTLQEEVAESWDSILKDIVLKGITIAEQTGEFVVEQSPDILRQFLLYKRTIITASILFSFILIWWGWKQGSKYFGCKEPLKEWEDSYTIFQGRYFEVSYHEEFKTPGIIAIVNCILSSVGALILFFRYISDLILVWVAPKVYLIEYVIDKL